MNIKIVIFLFFGISFFNHSEFALLLSSAVYCLYYLKIDFWPLKVNRFDISSVYVIGLLLNTISHLIAIIGINDPIVSENYLLRYIPDNLFEGLAVFHLGSVVIMETLRYYVHPRRFERAEIVSLLQLKWKSVLLGLIAGFLLMNFTSIRSYGSVGTILGLVVPGAILYLSIYAHFYNESAKINLLIFIVAFLSLWALRYSYLRYEIILPWASYFLGEVIARKRVMALTHQSKIILLALLIVIPPLFTFLGESRSKISGRSDKISLVITGAQQEQELEKGQTIMSRLSYINQLTHVVGLVKKNGFYKGSTLSYFSYVFIPRFIWPDKPTIQQGQWFALEAGLAYRTKGGKANNSINMTVPGEFYLNFGWLGVFVGCWVFGVFIVFIWHNIQGDNLLSWALQFYLLFGSLAGLGADIQIVVTLLSYYLIYKLYMIVIPSKKEVSFRG